jgi:hypothetical protein
MLVLNCLHFQLNFYFKLYLCKKMSLVALRTNKFKGHCLIFQNNFKVLHAFTFYKAKCEKNSQQKCVSKKHGLCLVGTPKPNTTEKSQKFIIISIIIQRHQMTGIEPLTICILQDSLIKRTMSKDVHLMCHLKLLKSCFQIFFV